MQRPVGEDSTPQYRHGPPAPVAPVQGPRMMAIGRPFPSSPAAQVRSPMMPPHPPFSPGGQQSHRFGPPPPPPMMAPGNAMTPPPRQVVAAAPPPLPPPPPSMLTLSSSAVPHPSMPPPPPPPPPPLMVRAAGMIPLGQHQPLPPVGESPAPLSLNSCTPPQLPQGSTLLGHTAKTLPPEPPKPKDDEVIRNIEVLTQFVVKNGSEFESMAQAKQAGNPKFSFLFGGEAGSDAAIGQEYYQWLKKKCQLEKTVGRDVEAKFQPAVPSISVGYNQHQKDSNFVSSEGPLPASDALDMEMDMDMEDDIAVPKPVNDDAKDFEITDRKGERHLTVSNQKAECIETLDCQVTSLVNAGGKHFEASQLEFQKEKGKIVSALEPPCVEDVSPVRPLPKEMQQNLNIEKSEVKSFSTVCGPPFASTAMAETKCTESSHVIEAGSEIAGFRENTSVQSSSHGDMECKKLEGVGHCFNIKSLTDGLFSKNFKDMLDSANNNISSDLDNMKSNIALATDSVKPNCALVSDNLISEVGLHGKLEGLPGKVDKYGRVIRKSRSDSESNDTKEVMDPSWSRSPSPRYERRRKRSHSNSPRRKSRWSRSHSRTPKRRRSRSRTPLHDFRRGGDLRYDRISRRRGTTPLCNDFAKGRCYRGASCRFFHEISGDDVNRWAGGRRTKGRSDSRQDTTMSVGAKDGLFFGELDISKSISPDKYFDGHDNRNLGERRNQDFEGQNSRNFGERKNQLFDVHDNLDSGERKHHDFYDNHNFGERKNMNDGYDKCNFGDRKNQEHYRSSDHSNNPCFNFLKGRCYRGLSCRYLHSETTTDNCGRWSGAGKGRERIENREDITKSYDGRDNYEGGEMKKSKIHSPINLSDEHYKHNIEDRRIKEVDRNQGRSVPKCIFFARGLCQRGSSCRFLHEDVSGDNVGLKVRGRSKSRVDVQDIPDSIRQRSQESEKHNDLSVDIVVNPQFESPCQEILQSRREELWASSLATVDAPPQHNHKRNLEHLPSAECLSFKAVLEGNVGQPLVSEGSTVESFKQKLEPDDPVENSCLHSNVNSHLTPHHFLPQDLKSLQNHAVLDRSLMFRQVHGSAGLSLMSENDASRGTSLSQLNMEDKVDLLPRGSPTNSSTMYRHSRTIACSMSYGCDSISSLPSLVPHPVPEVEHSKYGEVNHIANVSTDMVTDCTEKKSPCLQTSMESVFHFTGIREEHPATMSLLPMQNKSGQIASALLVDHCANGSGKMATTSTDQISGYSHTSLESLSHVSNIGQDGVTQRTITMPHFASQNKSEQSASAFGEQKMGFFSNCPGSSTSSLSAIYEPIKDMPAGGDLKDHLSVTGEHSYLSKGLSNKVSDSANNQDIKEIAGEPDKSILLNNVSLDNKVSHVKPSSPSRIQNISGNEKNKDALESSLMETVLHQAVHSDTPAGNCMLENRSPACEDKKSNPGAGTEGAVDVEIEQGHALDESKKSKEIKAIKQFRTVLAEFVKEELKPTWREGHMSKESFKTIVKKVVDKVAGSLQVHQMPKTQERIDQYIAASRSKLSKLIQGYVEKYVKS